MAAQTFIKDADAKLDYQLDWSAWLDDEDTIATSTWEPSDGLTVEDESHTTTTATVWLSGGTVGAYYTVTNRIVTAAGREDARPLLVRVAHR